MTFDGIVLGPEELRAVVRTVGAVVLTTVGVILSVAYLTYAERKVIGYMQARLGPNRVGAGGFFSPSPTSSSFSRKSP